MDMGLVTSILMAQAGNTQMQVATSVMKSNIDAEKSAVQTLLGISPSTANLGVGVGGNLNITA
jgi:hypothetical protein